MERVADFQPGQRVEIRGNPIGVELKVRTGSVLRADEWDGYYIIHLDAPARYRLANGEYELLEDIREAADNLIPLP